MGGPAAISGAGRSGAGVVTLLAIAGLVIQARATFAATGSASLTVWILAGYFTILANLFVAVLFAFAAAGRAVVPRWLAGATLAIMLVGIVYALLLRGLLQLSGGAVIANALLHYATPVITPLWWLVFAPKGRLGWRDPWRWAIFPAAYLPWALARGAASGHFAYPFLDFERHGWAHVAVACAVIAAGFVAAGFGMVWADGMLTRRR